MYTHNTHPYESQPSISMNWMGVWLKKNGRSQSQDQLVAGPWAGRSFSPVPGQPAPTFPISLCGQEGVERFVSSSLQCQLCPVLSWFLVTFLSGKRKLKSRKYLSLKKLYPQAVGHRWFPAFWFLGWSLSPEFWFWSPEFHLVHCQYI